MPSGGVPVASVGGASGRRPVVGVVLVAVALAIAILKPWAGAPASDVGLSAPTASGAPLVTRGPEGSPGGSPAGSVAEPACRLEAAWRLFAIETNSGKRVATWYSLGPVHATGPTDPSIPTIRIYAEALRRLGYCAASSGGGPRAVLGVDAWRVTPSGAVESVPLVRANEPGLDEAARGALFAPPPTTPSGAAPGAWPPGRYVFVVRLGTAPADDLWFAAQVVAVALPPAGTNAPSGMPAMRTDQPGTGPPAPPRSP